MTTILVGRLRILRLEFPENENIFFSCVNPNTEQQKEKLIRFVTCREIPFAKLAPFRSFSPRSDSTGCKTMNGRKHTVLRFCSQRLQHLQATSSRDSGFVSGVIVKPGHRLQGA